MNYPIGSIADLATIEMGQSPKGETVRRSPTGLPLLNGPTEFGQQHPLPAQWTDAGVRFARAGDVLFCVRGSTTGRMNRADQDYAIGRGIAALRARDGVDSRIVKYALDASLPNLLAGVSGSVFPNLSRDQILRHRVPVPPRAEQQAIAEVLGALDDKIAANAALAATATQLASAEFRAAARGAAWGPTFDEIANVSGGGTPSTKNPAFWDGDVFWATPTDMTALAGPYLESTARTITSAGLDACSSRLFEPGVIMMTSRATIGALAVNNVPTAVNQGFIVVEPNDSQMRWWLFHEMESRIDEFISWANGATFLELSRGTFRRLKVRVPTDDALQAFAASVTPLHDAARAALIENCTLAATRDTLLPQLMSGKLRVRDAGEAASRAGA
ncbi:restriction endonuclease subunit S [Microbacterium sp. NPDC058062]|uniref:restriction endonuclease subunit S n=1 Tax=Microbacterium sp. NPDC058062 TaxID=3346320 RepID=UPI0036DB6277